MSTPVSATARHPIPWIRALADRRYQLSSSGRPDLRRHGPEKLQSVHRRRVKGNAIGGLGLDHCEELRASTFGHWAGSSNYFNGAIDQVQILSRPLSSTEVGNEYSNQLPTVTVTAPTNNSTFTATPSAPINISLSATASDSSGFIAKVAFYQDDMWLCDGVSQGNGSYSETWANVSTAGLYAITARAIDNYGVVVISPVVNVTIGVAP